MKINKRQYIWILSILLVLGLFAFVLPYKGASSSDLSKKALSEQICNMANEAFTGGERITYKVYYNLNFIWIPAANVVFDVIDQGDRFHIKTTASTLKSYDWFFEVRDSYEVVIDKKTLLPISSIRQVQEGGYKLYDEIYYDHDRGVASSLRGKTKETATLKEFPVSTCVHDILSIIYYARNLDFENLNKGENFPVNIFMDKKEWSLNVQYGGRAPEHKVKGQGKFNTYLFHPELISGDIFEENTVMNVYASEDNNRVPLMIESPISVGSIKAVIESCENLRHEQNSKCP